MDAIATKDRLTAADVRGCIQSEFGMDGGQYAVLFEVRNGTAWRANRSVAAVVMSLWPSLGMELWGMEIKVSRGDWLRELNDPGKASEVFNYFDRWFLVAPEDVVKPGELPEPWGWYQPSNGRLRRARDAAKNAEVKTVDRHFLGALLRRTAKTDDAFVQTQIQSATKALREQHDKDIDHRVMQRMGDLRAHAEAWEKLSELLKGQPDNWVYQPDVIEAIQVLMKAGIAKSYGSLRSLLSETARFHDQIAAVADALGIDKPEPLQKPMKRRR